MTDQPTTHPDEQVVEKVTRLRDRAETGFPEAWIADTAGQELVGELVRYEQGTTPYGQRIIAVIRTPDGVERAVWLIHSVLLNEFASQRPKPGEFLLIRYEGKRESANGGPAYTSYKLVIDRDQSWAPNWDQEGDTVDLATPAPAPAPAPPSPAPAADEDIPF